MHIKYIHTCIQNKLNPTAARTELIVDETFPDANFI